MSAPSLVGVPLVDRYRAALRLAGEVDNVAMREELLAAALWPTGEPAADMVFAEDAAGQFVLDLEAAS